MAAKKRKKTSHPKSSATRVSKPLPKKRKTSSETRKRVSKKQLSIAERFAQAAPALQAVYKAMHKAEEMRIKADQAEERAAIQAEAFDKYTDQLEAIISPEKNDGESALEYARRCIQIAKAEGLELDYHYARIANLTGLTNKQVYTLWVSPGALVA